MFRILRKNQNESGLRWYNLENRMVHVYSQIWTEKLWSRLIHLKYSWYHLICNYLKQLTGFEFLRKEMIGVNNRSSLYDGRNSRQPLLSWNEAYPHVCCLFLFKQLISENLLSNQHNTSSTPISTCWPHYQDHCNCFLVNHQCKANKIPAEPV